MKNGSELPDEDPDFREEESVDFRSFLVDEDILVLMNGDLDGGTINE